MCPASLSAQSVDSRGTPVVYEQPSVAGGESPIGTPTCTPASGSIFLPGTSIVTCSAADATGRSNSCAFTVTVAVAPRIAATTFLAFGNSITEGKTASGAYAKSYPDNLSELLKARYTAQERDISVVNAGCGGEFTTAGGEPPCLGGAVRLPLVLSLVHPEAVLLEEGVNDLSNGSTSAIQPMIDSLRSMVQQSKSRGLPVFLATLPPERIGGSRAGAQPVIPAANDQIRILAISEHATLVDLYTGFAGSPDPYIDTDGLHPNELGYQKIAQLFFDAISGSLELKPAAAVPGLVRNMPSRNPFSRFR
jgi:lysophospholipase L1-like esterase